MITLLGAVNFGEVNFGEVNFGDANFLQKSVVLVFVYRKSLNSLESSICCIFKALGVSSQMVRVSLCSIPF